MPTLPELYGSLGVILVYFGTKQKIFSVIGTLLVFGGLITFTLFIVKLWIHLGRPADADARGDQAVVWIFPARHRPFVLSAMEVQMVSGLRHHDVVMSS